MYNDNCVEWPPSSPYQNRLISRRSYDFQTYLNRLARKSASEISISRLASIVQSINRH